MQKIKKYIPPLLWMGVILMFSTEAFRDGTTYEILDRVFGSFGISLTYAEIDRINFFMRKTAHFAVYAILAALWLRAFRKSGKGLPAAFVLTLAVSFFCAALDELHQSFEPLRTPLVSDVMIDITGAAIALLVFARLIKKRREAAAGSNNCQARPASDIEK